MEPLSEELLEHVLKYLFFLIDIFFGPNISVLILHILGVNPINIPKSPGLLLGRIVTQHLLEHLIAPFEAQELIWKNTRAVKQDLNSPLHPLIVPTNHLLLSPLLATLLASHDQLRQELGFLPLVPSADEEREDADAEEVDAAELLGRILLCDLFSRLV